MNKFRLEGVSITFRGSRAKQWLVRWREDRPENEVGKGEVQRSRSFEKDEDALAFGMQLRKDLRKKGCLLPVHDPSPPVELAPIAGVGLDDVLDAWLEWGSGTRNLRTPTTDARKHAVRRWIRAYRTAFGLTENTVVPINKLTITSFTKANEMLRRDHAESTTYQAAAHVFAMWRWAWDCKRWVCPEPPRTASLVVPRTPSWAAPPQPPRTEEVDAVVRRTVVGHQGSKHRRDPAAHRSTIIARYTGLRLKQVLLLRREDLDLDEMMFVVRHGKSQREMAICREIPIHPGLVRDLGGWLRTFTAGPLFPQAVGSNESMKGYRNPTRYVTDAWVEAQLAGEVRDGVLRPRNRKRNNPNHVFRAYLQNELGRAGVERHLIDWLVGHEGLGTREAHYASPPVEHLVDALARLPMVDWKGNPPSEAQVVPVLRVVGG